MMDIDRLKTDAAYWDAVAPEGATHYFTAGNGCRDGFYRNVSGRTEFYSFDGWSENCHKPYGDERECIARPTKPASPEWDGESMISVGEWAEGLLEVANGCREWQRCKCIGFLNGMAVVCSEEETMVHLLNHTCGDIRPLRTKEQRQKDELMEVIPHPGFSTKEDIAAAILAAGYRKQERD